MSTTASNSQTTRSRSWLLFLLSLVVAIVVLINAISRFLIPINPALALMINPLNSDARIELLTFNLSEEPVPARVEELEQLAIEGIALEPMDARFYSLLGIMRERVEKIDAAQDLYLHALELLPTEIQALTRRFVFDYNNANYTEAIIIADKISRRWRQHWNVIAPYLPYLLDNENAYQEALERFSSQNNGRQLLMSSLVSKLNSLDLAYRMIMDWHKLGESDLRASINKLSAKLVAVGQVTKAYQLFRLTLNDTEEKEVGYIFNPNFDLKPNGNLFDWKIAKQSGMSMAFKNMLFRSNSSAPISDSVLETLFLNSPVRFSAVLQKLMLPSSNFTLNLTYSTRDLVTPKPIKLVIECPKSRKILAVVRFLAGDITGKKLQLSFNVPVTNCDLQQIRIFNGNIVESWKNRYSGSLLLHNVSIKLGR